MHSKTCKICGSLLPEHSRRWTYCSNSCAYAGKLKAAASSANNVRQNQRAQNERLTQAIKALIPYQHKTKFSEEAIESMRQAIDTLIDFTDDMEEKWTRR